MARTSPLMIASARLGAIEAFLLRRLEAVELLELVDGHEARLFRDADRALALDVGVAANRQDAGAGLADIAAQQQQIDQHLHVLDAVDLLRQAHAVGR